MVTVSALGGNDVPVRLSKGSGVPYFEDWTQNVLPSSGLETWPPALLRQVNAYVARRNWFEPDDADALALGLGRISKFQSLNSEDAVTWSWFGTLALAPEAQRQAAVQWLYDRLELELERSGAVKIDQWKRVVHPNALDSHRGPELDARIDDPSGALIYVEAKWNAELGTGKGESEGEKDDQVELRRESLRKDPSLANDPRTFVVLGISNDHQDLTPYDEKESHGQPVRVAWITWDELAECDAHPLADDFRRYLEWKRDLSKKFAGAN